MRSLTLFLATLITSPVLAKSFDRPIPQAQSAMAEFWFALASLALIVALVLVQRMVARR
jgi:hypothetical protein